MRNELDEKVKADAKVAREEAERIEHERLLKFDLGGTKINFFLIGGAVRDSLLGKKSKDMDYAVEAPSLDHMKAAVVQRGGKIFVAHDEYVTIRAKLAPFGDCDFVLTRKDGTYDKDGRRPDFVEIGTLADDLARRDFTMNAMARDEAGNLIDPFNGESDLRGRKIRCVGNTEKRMHEDSLRVLRALRFSLTKDFGLAPELSAYLMTQQAADSLAHISIERIREELKKCFDFDTLGTLRMLEGYWRIRAHIFGRNLKLSPTIFVD